MKNLYVPYAVMFMKAKIRLKSALSAALPVQPSKRSKRSQNLGLQSTL